MTTIDRVKALEDQQAEILAILKRLEAGQEGLEAGQKITQKRLERLETGQERLEAGQERLVRFLWFTAKELLPLHQISRIEKQVDESFQTDTGRWLGD